MQLVESCCAANFYATFYKHYFFIEIALKLSYSCKKCKIFERWQLRPQTPVPPAAGGFNPRPPLAFGGWGLCPQTPKTSPTLRISGYKPESSHNNLQYSVKSQHFL